MQQLTAHFSLDELTWSDRAARMGINNAPPDALLPVLLHTAQGLERVRTLLERPMHITSGYRSAQLNADTPGSSPTSQHMRGEAADFVAPGFGTPLAICRAIALARVVIAFDELLYEYGSWVHVSFVGPGHVTRYLIMTKQYGSGYVAGLPAH